ncbi:MAG TPA: 4Fe-4S dicluster domain-containing protein [Firmicutes bacterium]|nr:4Fe-4S dicluster domain-containing protein [Bacillota bacterium]
MKRKIITIDEDRCNGCGLCINACHEGALQLIDGKARLISESYCDGLGDCLPACPTGAITIEEREAEPYNEEEVKRRMEHLKKDLPCGCPGSQAKTINPAEAATPFEPKQHHRLPSQLQQWPCQLRLVPVHAPYFNQAHLLIAADCTAYAYANIHNDFMKNKITLIGCPKLDAIDYTEKLTEILRANEIKSVTVLRMEVPCCSGIVNALKGALINSKKMIPWQVITIATDGTIIDQ